MKEPAQISERLGAGDTRRARKELAVCLLVSFLFGMLHIFSIFVLPLEAAFDTGRAAISFSYSLAIVCLALSVMWGHRFYGRFSPTKIFVFALVLGAIGLEVASLAPKLWGVWLGYGVVFGAANGLGYGFSLQFAARVWPTRSGWAMGLVTAAYAMGASVMPPVSVWVMGFAGWNGALQAQAGLYIVAIPVVWVLLRGTRVRFERAQSGATRVRAWDHRHLWLAYGLAVFAGLMVLSQASEIVRDVGAVAVLATAAPMVTAGANLIGSLFGGWAADRFAARRVLMFVPFGSAIVLLATTVVHDPVVMVAGVSVVGFFYGATIAAYPAAISKAYPGPLGLAVYGAVFTAWGAAGVLGPATAGFLFDGFGGYAGALGIAGVLALASGMLWAVRPHMLQIQTET